MLKWIAIMANIIAICIAVASFYGQFGPRFRYVNFSDWAALVLISSFFLLNIIALYRTGKARIGRVVELWLSAKEAELGEKAGRKSTDETA